MARSIYKGPYVEHSLMRKICKIQNSGADMLSTVIKTWSRRSTIMPNFIGYIFDVHNGKRFHRVIVSAGMVGRKLGEFSPTRTFVKHSGDVKNIKPVSKIKKR